MKISIIIPVYNVALYLRECLDSVLAQTYPDWEAICVDDGSTDGSGAILDEYAAKDARVRVVHKENEGVSAARNLGISIARGEWIHFLDSDDVLFADALSIFVNIEHKADVTFFSCTQFYASGFKRGYVLPDWPCMQMSSGDSSRVFDLAFSEIGDVFGWTWNKFIRSAIVFDNEIRFDSRVKYFEDELFALAVMDHATTFATIDRSLYGYRVMDAGLTARGGAANLYKLGQCFAEMSGSLANQWLKAIAFRRAMTWFRLATFQGCRWKSAVALWELKKNCQQVRWPHDAYNGFLLKTVRFPKWLGVLAIFVFHCVHK